MMEFLPEQVQGAVIVALAAAVLATGVWQGLRLFIARFGSDTPRWLNQLAPTVLSASLAGYTLAARGYDAGTLLLAVIIALFAPKTVYQAADLVDRGQKALKEEEGP